MHGVWGWIGQEWTEDPQGLLSELASPQELGQLTREQGTWRGALEAWGWEGKNEYCIDGLLVGFAGRPRGRYSSDEEGYEFAKWLAATYRASPYEKLPEKLSGPFALAILDPERQEALLAVDRLGVWDLSYALRGGTLVFGPRADLVAKHSRIRAPIAAQGIFSYMYHHSVPRPNTIFQGVYRLCPGQLVIFHKRNTDTRSYWQPTYSEEGHRGYRDLQEQFRHTLRSAVARNAPEGQLGTFLSGGTDSSTVTGMLGEVTGEAPHSFAIGFNAPGYDETKYARIAAHHFGACHHEYFVTPQDVVETIPLIAEGFAQPFGNASVIPSYHCAKLARETGVKALLGGDGGDELFAGNTRYAKQWLLSLYGRFPAWVRRGLFSPISSIPGGERIPPLRKVQRYIEQGRLPLVERWQSYNLLEFIGYEQLFTREFLGLIDTYQPFREMQAEFDRFRGKALVNQLMGVDLKYVLADDDLRKVTGAGELAGIETRFPFLDEAVVEMASALPPGEKMKGTRLRHFFKEALEDYLPREILRKEKHGFGLPFGVWLQEPGELRDLAFDSLQDLRQRGIIRPDFIDELANHRLSEHAAYFGTLVWVLMMLEQWFQTQ